MWWKRLDTGHPDRLVYRNASPLGFGLGFFAAGVAPLVWFLIDWSIQGEPNAWIVFCLCWWTFPSLILVVLAAHLLVRRWVILDRTLRQATISWRWLFLHKTVIQGLAGLDRVTWRHFAISLCGAEAAVVELFTARSLEDARRFTSEIAGFLGISADPWEERLLARLGQRQAERWLDYWIGRRSMRKLATANPHELRYCQGFPSTLKFFAWFFLLIGLVFLVVGLTQGPALGKDYFGFLTVGIVFPLLALLLLLGRRGITFDKQSHCVIFLWGLAAPMLWRRYELYPFHVVTVKTQVKDMHNYLAVQTSVKLTGDKELVIHDHNLKEEAESMAQEIATFLGWELQRANIEA